MNEIERKEIIAYFSMEIGLESMMPTYSVGFGMLAGDTIRSAADMGIPLVALTLLHRKGYFRQHIDARRRKVVSKAERVNRAQNKMGFHHLAYTVFYVLLGSMRSYAHPFVCDA